MDENEKSRRERAWTIYVLGTVGFAALAIASDGWQRVLFLAWLPLLAGVLFDRLRRIEQQKPETRSNGEDQL